MILYRTHRTHLPKAGPSYPHTIFPELYYPFPPFIGKFSLNNSNLP